MSVNLRDQSTDSLEDRVLHQLRQVHAGEDGPDIVSSGQVYDVVATGGAVRVLLDPDKIPDGSEQALAEAITPLVEAIPGAERAIVKPRPRPVSQTKSLHGVDHVVGIHSGKGGVGKSTVTVNLAVALARQGYSVGLLDADIYGPSAPTLLGLKGRAETTDDGERIAPMEAFGVRFMSLGLLLPEDQALIWRGSLVDQGLPQLFHDIDWGELDILLVDLPPGTSDVHLAVAQSVPLSGIITVTAPGQVSIDDVRRGLEMFADIAVPCIGLVENMAGITCHSCGHQSHLFGHGGADELSGLTGLPVLCSLAFTPQLAVASDQGKPVASANNGTEQSFLDLSTLIADRVGLVQASEVQP